MSEDSPAAPAANGSLHPLAAGSMGASTAIVLVWALQTFAHVQVPAEVGMAFSTLAFGLAHQYLGVAQ